MRSSKTTDIGNGEYHKAGIVRSGKELVELGLLEPSHQAQVDELASNFAMAITPNLLDLIESANPSDPIARQFIPSCDEAVISPEEMSDPIGDSRFTSVKGIIHRYPDRLILHPLLACQAHCRFCFRRERVGQNEAMLPPSELENALKYIREHEEIWEVILSGGDPLALSEQSIAHLMRSLDSIPHVEVIRIHTRVPVVTPQRITPLMVKALEAETTVYVVLHCNHPRELTSEVSTACAAIIDAGIPMLSQTVLLKGINDNPDTMSELLRKLVRTRIKPYYLHQCDLVKGTSHFRTSIEEGQHLLRALRGRLSGICQPLYVLDIPGGYGKVPVGPAYLSRDPIDDWYLVEDYKGAKHRYPPGSK
jgi:lysine 2,3-aminomutase